MGVSQVFGHQVAIPLVYLVLLSDDFDSSSAWRGSWLQNVHVFKVVHFSVIHPPFVILWENVGCRCNFEVPTMFPPLLLHITPHVGFRTKTPGIWEMVYFLLSVHMLQLVWSYESWPHAVPGDWPVTRSDEMKACSFECVDYTVINMSLANSKGQVTRWLQLLLSDHLNPFLLEWSLHLQKRRVVEEYGWLTAWYRPIVKHDHVVWRSLEEQLLLADGLSRFCSLF